MGDFTGRLGMGQVWVRYGLRKINQNELPLGPNLPKDQQQRMLLVETCFYP